MTLERALNRLYARVPLGMRLGLDPMRAACMRAGHPERAFDTVHIGGTNGKGSTCAMVEAIVRASGKRTGLYTSPHLCRFAERIRIDGEPIDDDTLARTLDEALDVGHDLSFFETATLAAFLAFRSQKVDLAVIEVGIGGRLDATNILDAPPPRCTAITSIAFDHMDKLGTTLDAIAGEKAAIAKARTPLVLGPLPETAHTTVLRIAERAGARIVETEPRSEVGLEGDHQRANAGVAWAVAAELGIDAAQRTKGLRDARWPGRLERVIVEGSDLAGPWILDGAHNEAGMLALLAAMKNEELGAVVFGALADKAWPRMLELLGALPTPRVYVAPAGRAAVDPHNLALDDTSSYRREVGFTHRRGLELARDLAGQRPVLVCGSLYLVGEARRTLLDLPADPLVAL